ncbi:N-6 DNA methylase [Clostridium sp. OF09-36]|uniref:N-6 DNA methylase n=1 Tax=Clostridium sp. OF09-36 TaxID=2292310 RepID=UPI000E4AE6EC|nr:N-6 DNA methylase [Clostridium sp. OF09-36]RHV86934.1 N-6 DNA methylase [Clostridium sp. OF09-36]
MELKELTEWLLDLLGIQDVKEIPEALMKVVKENNTSKYEKFSEKLPDMSTDWLQKVYQYYLADRKEKMQDYTPKSLARFVSRLAGEQDVVIDMCAGSGALTIQKWSIIPNQKFCLYEFDANVIPLLLFNMAVRNIECKVCHADVLQDEIYHTYIISHGDKFGVVKEMGR